MADEFTNLLTQIQDLSTQLAMLLSKSEFLSRDIFNLCEDRKRIEGEIGGIKEKIAVLESKIESSDLHDLQKKIAVLETKAEYAKTTCEALDGKVSTLQEINWKLVGALMVLSAAVSIATPFVIKLVFN